MIIGNGISPFKRLSGSSISFDADANAYFARASAAGSPYDSTNKSRITNLFIYLKTTMGIDGTTSLYNSLDCLNLAGGSKAVLALNALSATVGNWTYSVDSGTYTAYKGYKGNGTTTRVDSNFNPFDGGNYKFKTNDNCFGGYINTNTREVKGLISNVDGTQNGYEIRTHTNGCTSVNGTTATKNANGVDSTGFHTSMRTVANNTNAFKNAKNNAVDTNSVVTSTVNKTFKLFCRDIGGTYSLFSLNRLSCVYFGSSNIDIIKLERAIVSLYLAPVGGALTKRVLFDGNSFFDSMTMPTKVMDLLWTAGIECTSHYNAVFGIPISTMISNAPAKIDAYKESYFTKECFIFWELTNSMKGASADVNTTFTNLQTYFNARRAAGLTMPIICNTCPPFDSTNTTSGIYPSKRDNQADITDVTKINGKIRGGLATLGIQNASDETYDTIMLDSNGVAGVGELNTTYFQADGHMTTVGYNYVGQNHLYPKALIHLT